MTDFNFRDAVEQVAQKHDTTVAAIVGPARSRKIAAARHEVMATCHQAGWSKSRIARELAMDHSAVIHGIRRHHERQAQQNSEAI